MAAKGAVAARKKSSAVNSTEKERSEFLVIALSGELKVGSSVRILGVSEKEDEALKQLQALTDSGVVRAAIVEKRGVFTRRPAVVVNSVKGNIVKAAVTTSKGEG